MSVVVKNNSLSVSPQKVRGVINLIRGKKVEDALNILRFCPKKDIAVSLTKLLNSGLDIASKTSKFDLENLVVGTIFADAGPTLKRVQPRAQGRAFRIRKRTSRVTVELKES